MPIDNVAGIERIKELRQEVFLKLNTLVGFVQLGKMYKTLSEEEQNLWLQLRDTYSEQLKIADSLILINQQNQPNNGKNNTIETNPTAESGGSSGS